MSKARARRVLVCEDSRTYAAGLRRLLEHDGEFQVVGTFASAEAAIAALPGLDPDVVTMDVELPGMTGLEAVEEIMSVRPVPILVLSSHVGVTGATAAAALAAGALDAVAKDDLDLRNPGGASAVAFRRRLAVLSRAHVIRHPRARLRRRAAVAASAGHAASVVGIVASTGGPQVLATLLGSLPASYPIPVLVVQHISHGFTDGLVHWLDRTARLPVQIAEDGAHARSGIWVAPEGAHLRLEPGGVLTLDRRTVRGHHRPSGDVLLESLAAAADGRGVAVVLTGMGRDGAAGAAAVKACGGLALAQDAQSSAIYGMPKAAIEQGAEGLSLDALASLLLSLRPAPL